VSFPESLEQLSPKYLTEIPQDLFTEKPHAYQTTDDRSGMLVYSLGENETDDGGLTLRRARQRAGACGRPVGPHGRFRPAQPRKKTTETEE
jgi:hypothetical protein